MRRCQDSWCAASAGQHRGSTPCHAVDRVYTCRHEYSGLVLCCFACHLLNNLAPSAAALPLPCVLSSASCTCVAWRRLNKDKASNQQWRRFYRSRWLVTDPAGSSNEETCWQSRFGSKMSQVTIKSARAAAFYGYYFRFTTGIHTHTHTCCCVCLVQGKSWAGRYEHDCLYGHKASIKALRLLPSSGVMMTGTDAPLRHHDPTHPSAQSYP
jgi:hypothetical protein